MRVLVISQYWSPENGVPQRRWTWLSEIMRKSGVEVLVVAPHPSYLRNLSWKEWRKNKYYRVGDGEELGVSGERILRTPLIPARSSLTARAVQQAFVAAGAVWHILRPSSEVRGFNPDVVIGTVPALPTAYVSAVAAYFLRKPFIIDLRDAWPDLLEHTEQWNKGVKQAGLYEKILRIGPMSLIKATVKHSLNFLLNRANGLMFTSEEHRKQLIGRLIQKDKPTVTIRNVFPSGINQPSYHSGDESSVAPLKVLYAGTLGRAQYLDNALEAAMYAERLGAEVELRFVGVGASLAHLQSKARDFGVEVDFAGRQAAWDMEKFYSWADTALVHLADWEPLNRAVPSKTFELMERGIHISGVVSGEAGALITDLSAGDVVRPGEPQRLAKLWFELWSDRSRLNVSEQGVDWVRNEREEIAPYEFLELLLRV